jgi:hypothetical protein
MSSIMNPAQSFSGADFDLSTNGEAALFVEMEDAYSQLEDQALREVLLDSLDLEKESVRAIARGFGGFLADCEPTNIRRQFFASWQKTNNSAMSVEGLANRMTAEGEAKMSGSDAPHALSLFRAAGRLNRVADEDLGVGGQALHFELYYRMATEFTGQDDQWQCRHYCIPAAVKFKTWLDTMRLRSPIMVGLYSLLVHEGYTHAELGIIETPFFNWAIRYMNLTEHEARRVLAWISVHNGGTEKAHFAHSCASLAHYLDGCGATVDLRTASETFREYFRLKGAVMAQLSETFRDASAGFARVN